MLTKPALIQPKQIHACQPAHLLRHNRQHLQVDAVELIKASPGPRGREALEEFAL